MDDYMWLNRTLCDVLSDMRKCFEIRNFCPLMGLIEEAQIMGNRMEAGLSDSKDLEKLREDVHVLKQEKKKLKAELPKKETKEPTGG